MLLEFSESRRNRSMQALMGLRFLFILLSILIVDLTAMTDPQRPVTQSELIEYLEPLIKKLDQSNASSITSDDSKVLHNSISEYIGASKIRLAILEERLDQMQSEKQAFKYSSDLAIRFDKRSNMSRQLQAPSRSFALMEILLGMQREWDEFRVGLELRDLSSLSGRDSLFDEAYSRSGSLQIKTAELEYQLTNSLAVKLAYAPMQTNLTGLLGYDQWRDDPQSVGQIVFNYDSLNQIPIKLVLADLKNLENPDFFNQVLNQGWDYGFVHLSTQLKQIYGGDLNFAWLRNRDIPRSMIPDLLPGRNFIHHFATNWHRKASSLEWNLGNIYQAGVGRRRAIGEFDFKAWMLEFGVHKEFSKRDKLGLNIQAYTGDRLRGNRPGNCFEGFVPVFPAIENLLGKADVVGPSNVIDTRISWQTQISKPSLKLNFDFHHFRLMERSSGALLLQPAQNQTRVGIQNPDLPATDSQANFDSDLGRELNLELDWQRTQNSKLKLGYAKFWGGKYFSANKPQWNASPELDTTWIQADFSF